MVRFLHSSAEAAKAGAARRAETKSEESIASKRRCMVSTEAGVVKSKGLTVRRMRWWGLETRKGGGERRGCSVEDGRADREGRVQVEMGCWPQALAAVQSPGALVARFDVTHCQLDPGSASDVLNLQVPVSNTHWK